MLQRQRVYPPGASPSLQDLLSSDLSSNETGIPEGFWEEVVSWKAPVPHPSPSLERDCAVWGPSWFRGPGTPWAGFCSPEARKAWEGKPPRRARLCQSTHAAASGSGGRAAGVAHDVTDNDTSRVSHSPTAPEVHDVTPGTPGTPRSWREHLATCTAALCHLRPPSASQGSWPGPARQGAGGRAPRAGRRTGDVTGSGGWVTRR